MSRKNENWLLVEWSSGEREVVHVNSVLNPLDFEIGDKLTANRRGQAHTATLISRAIERDQLSIKSNEEVAGPSPKPDEEPAAYCSSGSSWAPSDDECLSADSDQESCKKIKYDPIERQFINCRTSKKVLTPSHRANAVIPKMFKNHNKNFKNNVTRKRAHNGINRNEILNKSLPDSTKRHNTSNVKHMVTIDVRELTEISNSFRVLFKMVEELKKTMHPDGLVQHNVVENIVQLNEPVEENTVQTFIDADEACEDEEQFEEEEFNRSDDNVLITNKYDNKQNKTKEIKQIKETVKHGEVNNKKDEWVPIGSGKTLIHIDQFRKVKWKSFTVATRTLLLAVFPRRILATHSLTGKRSPAFQNKPAKMCLDPKIISDVIIEIMDRFDVKENLIRGIITTKCADECKMMRMRQNKKKGSCRPLPLKHQNQENEEPMN